MRLTLNTLPSELILTIAEYVQTYATLSSLSLIDSQLHGMIFAPQRPLTILTSIFDNLFLRVFKSTPSANTSSKSLATAHLKLRFKLGNTGPSHKNGSDFVELPHPLIFPQTPPTTTSQFDLKLGYFGFQPLSSSGTVAVWGDFEGVKICSPSNFKLISNSNSNYNSAQIISLCDSHGSVLTLLSHPNYPNLLHMGTSQGGRAKRLQPHYLNKLIFLTTLARHRGAAGTMISIPNIHHPTPNNPHYNFNNPHTTSEITCLLPSNSNPSAILSASFDGTVVVFPNGLNPNLNFNLSNPNTLITNNSAITALATYKQTLLVTGDVQGKIKIWKSSGTLLQTLNGFTPIGFLTLCCINALLTAHPNSAKPLLISANNLGEIRVYSSAATSNFVNFNFVFKGHEHAIEKVSTSDGVWSWG